LDRLLPFLREKKKSFPLRDPDEVPKGKNVHSFEPQWTTNSEPPSDWSDELETPKEDCVDLQALASPPPFLLATRKEEASKDLRVPNPSDPRARTKGFPRLAKPTTSGDDHNDACEATNVAVDPIQSEPKRLVPAPNRHNKSTDPPCLDELHSTIRVHGPIESPRREECHEPKNDLDE
jgi:hypothetical protein